MGYKVEILPVAWEDLKRIEDLRSVLTHGKRKDVYCRYILI